LISSPVRWNSTVYNFEVTGNYVNLPALLICLLLSSLLMLGVQESSRLNAGIVVVKTTVILLFIFASIKWINPSNYQPFVPPSTGQYGHFGGTGILQGATKIFFAYIGFDAVSTVAQECKKPQRDMPIGIIASLAICTVLYMATAICLTGLVSYRDLAGVPYPISYAMSTTGLTWMTIIIDIGAVAGLTSVLLVSFLGQTRVFMSMSNDGLLPAWAGWIHPRFQTPFISTMVCGTVCGICAALLPIDILSDMTSVGTLAAFALVSIAVMILRYTHPDEPRKFRVPLGPFVIPMVSAVISLLLIFISDWPTIVRLFLWMLIGFFLYFVYGFRKSKLRRLQREHRAMAVYPVEIALGADKARGGEEFNKAPPPYEFVSEKF